MHRDEDLGRRDDIYSLLFMFIELHSGLPWQEDKNKDDISSKKLYFEEHPAELAKILPAELDGNFPALRLLTFYSRPNYRTVYEGLLAIMKRCRVKMTDRYDFETESEHAAWVSAEGLKGNLREVMQGLARLDSTVVDIDTKVAQLSLSSQKVFTAQKWTSDLLKVETRTLEDDSGRRATRGPEPEAPKTYQPINLGRGFASVGAANHPLGCCCGQCGLMASQAHSAAQASTQQARKKVAAALRDVDAIRAVLLRLDDKLSSTSAELTYADALREFELATFTENYPLEVARVVPSGSERLNDENPALDEDHFIEYDPTANSSTMVIRKS
ncbi:unnamed protein product, partial [Mesorhabditis spiculigera]